MQNEAKCVKQKDFPLAFFFSFMTRCILRCFVLESLLCCMNLDFCVVSSSPGSLPEILLFPCVHLSSPEMLHSIGKTKKLQERSLTLVRVLHSMFLLYLLFPPVFCTLLFKFWEKAHRSDHLVDPLCTRGLCICVYPTPLMGIP